MDLINLFKAQKIDEFKLHENSQEKNKVLMQKKLLALQAELGSLVIKAGCCNFLEDGNASTKQSLFEKYILCFRLMINIGIEKEYVDICIEPKVQEYDLTQQFLDLFIDLNDFVTCSFKDDYVTFLEDYLSLGLNLGFTENEIRDGIDYKSNIILS